jgi:hypothetical protein
VLTSISTLSAQAQEQRNITAYIHFNKEAIKNGGDLSDAYFTVDGQIYGTVIYDMSDWVYGDESFPDLDILAEAHPKELVVPDDTKWICLTAPPSYEACNNPKHNVTEVHFRYPVSW